MCKEIANCMREPPEVSCVVIQKLATHLYGELDNYDGFYPGCLALGERAQLGWSIYLLCKAHHGKRRRHHHLITRYQESSRRIRKTVRVLGHTGTA